MTVTHDEDPDIALGDRVEKLMKERGLKQKHLAQILDIQESGANRALKGLRRFTAPEIKRLAIYFQVTSDHLLGLVDTPSGPGDRGGGETVAPPPGLEPGTVRLTAAANHETSKRISRSYLREVTMAG